MAAEFSHFVDAGFAVHVAVLCVELEQVTLAVTHGIVAQVTTECDQKQGGQG